MDKPTLLEITQDVLNDISGDEVDSINDTVESIQTAAIVRSTFFGMMTSRNWPHTRNLTKPLSDATSVLPTHIEISDNVKEVISINYDKSKDPSKLEVQEVKYLSPEDFLRVTNNRNSNTSTTKIVVDPSGVTLTIDSTVAPKYYTSFNDKTIVFDSYDSSVGNFLESGKFQIYAYIMPEWIHEDDFVPPLPIEAFPSLIEEVKSRVAVKLRQQPDQKAEQESTRQRRFLARKGWTINGGIKFPDYGRRRGLHYGRDSTFRRD